MTLVISYNRLQFKDSSIALKLLFLKTINVSASGLKKYK